MINCIMFIYFLILCSSFSMLFSNQPIYSVISLISVFFNSSILFILLNLDFIGILFILIYVGAIAIIFLFVVMLLDIKQSKKNVLFYIAILLFICFSHLIYLIGSFSTYLPSNLLLTYNDFMFSNMFFDTSNNIYLFKKIGIVLFLEYYLCLFISGIILLISLMCSIYFLNNKKSYNIKCYYNQTLRKNTLLFSNIL